jgi:hypothetical protein
MVERAYVLQDYSLPFSRGASCWIMWVLALVKRLGRHRLAWREKPARQIAEGTPALKREPESECLTLADARHGEFLRVMLLETGGVWIDRRPRRRPPMHHCGRHAGAHDSSGSYAASSGVRADVLSHTDPGNPRMTLLCCRWSRGTS